MILRDAVSQVKGVAESCPRTTASYSQSVAKRKRPKRPTPPDYVQMNVEIHRTVVSNAKSYCAISTKSGTPLSLARFVEKAMTRLLNELSSERG